LQKFKFLAIRLHGNLAGKANKSVSRLPLEKEISGFKEFNMIRAYASASSYCFLASQQCGDPYERWSFENHFFPVSCF